MVRLILGILLCIWSFLMLFVSINLKEPLDAAGVFTIIIFLIPGVLHIIFGRRARKIKREKKATQVTDTKMPEEKISSPPINAINQSEKILDKAQFANKFNNSDKNLGFFEGEIPLDFKDRVLSKAKINSAEKVILFIDQGVFNRGIAGLVFTEKGIYKYGRISCKFYPYSVIQTLSLQNVDKTYCNISVFLSSNVRYPLDQIASAKHVAFFKLLTPYIANIEIDKPDIEIRIDMVKKGCFFASIDRWDEKIRGALCYLVFPVEKAKIKIKEDGIDFGKLQIFRKNIGRGYNRGITPVDFMITAASSKEVNLFISWSKIHGFGKELFLDSISEKTKNIEYDREKRSVYVFFNNEEKNREEWLRIEMCTVQERDLFLDAVKYSERRIDLKRENVG